MRHFENNCQGRCSESGSCDRDGNAYFDSLQCGHGMICSDLSLCTDPKVDPQCTGDQLKKHLCNHVHQCKIANNGTNFVTCVSLIPSMYHSLS